MPSIRMFAAVVVLATAAVRPAAADSAADFFNGKQINIVVSGQVRFRVGTEETTLGAGGVLLMPRHVEHELWNDTQDFAQIIEIYTPPGMEQKFAAAGAAAIEGGKSFADADDYATSRSA